MKEVCYMEEIWKSIDMIDKYSSYGDVEVSNLGNCRKKYLDTYKTKRPYTNNGYKRLRIRNRVEDNVHRLVGLLFLTDDYNELKKKSTEKLIVHHIIFDESKPDLKFDNQVSNLQWVTQSQHSLIHNKKSSF